MQTHTIRDHFLSGEDFGIFTCPGCELQFTNPRPEPENLARYYQSDEYLSHTAAKKGLVSGIYKFVRNISLRKKYSLISKYKPSGSILDVGCGTGEFLNFMKQHRWETTGIEPTEEARNFASEQYGLNVLPEEKIDELPASGFDVITLWHVLEHVPDLNGRMVQLKRLLKDDGLMVFALPNPGSWDAAYYGSYWAAWDVPRHLYHFNKTSFTKLLEKHLLKLISVHPMKFDSFYVSLLSEKYKSGRQNFLRASISGLKSNISANRNQNNYSSLIYLVKKQNQPF
ncbi:MAG: class I SAM-dependent methyltransferase [Bacteroidales bacterium]